MLTVDDPGGFTYFCHVMDESMPEYQALCVKWHGTPVGIRLREALWALREFKLSDDEIMVMVAGLLQDDNL